MEHTNILTRIMYDSPVFVPSLKTPPSKNVSFYDFLQWSQKWNTLQTCTGMRYLDGNCCYIWPTTCAKSTWLTTLISKNLWMKPGFIWCQAWIQMAGEHPLTMWALFFLGSTVTGKSFLEALILGSVNPQYEERLLNYQKNTSSEQYLYLPVLCLPGCLGAHICEFLKRQLNL